MLSFVSLSSHGWLYFFLIGIDRNPSSPQAPPLLNNSGCWDAIIITIPLTWWVVGAFIILPIRWRSKAECGWSKGWPHCWWHNVVEEDVVSRRGSCCRTYGRRVLLSKMGKYGRRASSNRIIIEGDRGVGRGDRSTISGSVTEDRRYLLVLNGEVVILMLLVL